MSTVEGIDKNRDKRKKGKNKERSIERGRNEKREKERKKSAKKRKTKKRKKERRIAIKVDDLDVHIEFIHYQNILLVPMVRSGSSGSVVHEGPRTKPAGDTRYRNIFYMRF